MNCAAPIVFRAVLLISFCLFFVPIRHPRAAESNSSNQFPDPAIIQFVKSLDLETLLGQTLMIGVQAGPDSSRANDELRKVIQKYKPGGVILYEGNFPVQFRLSHKEMALNVVSLTNSLQLAAFSSQATNQKIPLFIAADQEGGRNMVITQGITRVPNHVFLGATRSADLTRQAGLIIGSEMKSLGVNMVLAPVADINNNSENDVIGKRAFGAHQGIVSPLSEAFMSGLQAGGVLSVAKHFPGHGNSSDNPHIKLARLGYDEFSQLENNDLVPFRRLISANVDGIMTAHILAPPLDRVNPVTISEAAIRKLLRHELGFQGLILTDDLAQMMGILFNETRRVVRTRSEVAQRALMVGSDILIFGQVWLEEDRKHPERSVTLAEFDAIYSDLLRFFGSDPDRRNLLEEAVARILAAKSRIIPRERFADPSVWSVDLDWEIYRASLADHLEHAEAMSRNSVVLISERGSVVDFMDRSMFFGPERGPLSPGTIIDQSDTLTLVSPVFQPPDEFKEALAGEWILPDQVRTVHLVYGWRNEEALQEATQLWGEKVERLSHFNDYGDLIFRDDAIERKAEEILRESRNSKAIVFGVMFREHAKVLEYVCRKLADDPSKIIVAILFVEPYFVPRDLYHQRNTVFLYASPLPHMRLMKDILFGRLAPRPVSYLPISVPPLIDRAVTQAVRVDELSSPAEDTKGEPLVTIKPNPGKEEAPRNSFEDPSLESSGEQFKLPPNDRNNLWYRYANSDTAIVFVHGVLSDSRGCWLYEEKGRQRQYWPQLIKEDSEVFGDADIYLGGYYTEVDSGPYEVSDCAREVMDALRRPESGRAPVMGKRRIVFVAHSLGGVVTRYLLERNYAEFSDKNVGLVLIASPSWGSKYANKLSWLSKYFENSQGVQLRWGNWNLRDLDSRFKDLVYQRRIPGLRGIEAIENRFIIHRKWLSPIEEVVPEESAGRYFGSPVRLRNTDHFSAAKPDGRTHPAHQLLVDFWNREFRTERGEAKGPASRLMNSK